MIASIQTCSIWKGSVEMFWWTVQNKFAWQFMADSPNTKFHQNPPSSFRGEIWAQHSANRQKLHSVQVKALKQFLLTVQQLAISFLFLQSQMQTSNISALKTSRKISHAKHSNICVIVWHKTVSVSSLWSCLTLQGAVQCTHLQSPLLGSGHLLYLMNHGDLFESSA